MAGVTLAVIMCEMMADDSFALDKEGAKVYARGYGSVFIEGQEVFER
jgi:3,4-dihydroxy-2-butanone 4-phosphate synthase